MLLVICTHSLRASMIWILGEYCDRIDEVEEILGSFLEGFQDENSQVITCITYMYMYFVTCINNGIIF